MVLHRFTFLFFALTSQLLCSQIERNDVFANPKNEEFQLKSYAPEPDAPGVILYEAGYYYAIPIIKRTSVRLVKEIHRKILVLDAKKFDYSTVEIPYFEGNEYYGEEIKDYKAVTHNGSIKKFVTKEAFYKSQKSGVGNVLKFTFPDVQNGSILEYSYTIVSPYFYNLDGWEFQHELPTIYSEFKTELPPHFRYNRILYGNRKLAIENAVVNKDAFLLPSNNGHIDTELDTY